MRGGGPKISPKNSEIEVGRFNSLMGDPPFKVIVFCRLMGPEEESLPNWVVQVGVELADLYLSNRPVSGSLGRGEGHWKKKDEPGMGERFFG